MDSSFSRQRSPLIWRRHCSISWLIVLQYDVKAISRIFSDMKFFRRSVGLTNQSHACLHPFDKPIKSLHFRLFIVSVLFASFHFKVIRKSHYKYGNSRLKTLKTIPCYAVHTRLGQISPPPPLLPLPYMKVSLTGPVVFEAFRHILETLTGDPCAVYLCFPVIVVA